jgi:hypothetical protein
MSGGRGAGSRPTLRLTTRIALIGVLLFACGQAVTGPAPSNAARSGGVPASPSGATPVEVVESAYGRIAIRTAAGASCRVGIGIAPPTYGDLPPTSIEGIAEQSGSLALTYPAPHLPGGTGRHEVRCGTGTASAPFAIPALIGATRFSARIRAPAVNERIPGATGRLEAALVPQRDRDVEALNRSLVSEWSAATRGLGTLDLVTTASADIVITVLPGRDTSVHVTAGDGSQAIFLYAADASSVLTPDNLVAVALHEVGHIWCCRGPEASNDGHWATAVADPLLQGVDRFGLMNHPVQCLVFGSVESCPNRFSERDLRAMGFTRIPPPPRNACVDAKNALIARISELTDQIARAKAAVDATDASLAALNVQIRSLEARYPSGMPPDVYASYSALIDRYNAGVATERAQVSAYNGLVVQSNGVVDQVNALLC